MSGWGPRGSFMELFTMTPEELRRVQTLQRVLDRALTQRAAALELGLSERQVRRLARALATGQPGDLISKRRGQPPNNRISEECAQEILAWYRAQYYDFGPSFFAEQLAQRHDRHVSREWLRRLLIQNGLWRAKRRKRNVHPPRERRPRFGELVQMDGSPHDWFEGRGPRCALLLAVDDATSAICSARFEAAETTDGYFRLLRSHIERYGRFLTAYPDKHSIFRYSGPSDKTDVVTQCQRAFDELGIELICANSPQAKGRVERANRTFQDRLTKTMRLEGIADLAAANAFLPVFVSDYNTRFAIKPAADEDAHRSADGFDLDYILCQRKERSLSKNLTVQIGDHLYGLCDAEGTKTLAAGMRVELRIRPDGRMTAHRGDRELTLTSLGKRTRNAPIVGAKELNAHLDSRAFHPEKSHKPAANHPWRTFRAPAP